MSLLDSLFDRYALLARQRPALLMLFPILVAAVVIFPALQSWWATLLAVAGSCGISVGLAEFAQARGKAIEPRLIAGWDGLPSVAMLRHRDNRLDRTSKARYKAFLETHVSGLQFPDHGDEERDRVRADDAYQSATRWLLSQTRDKIQFALLFQKNISYGFRRNLLGLRPYGISLSIAALLAVTAAGIFQFVVNSEIDSTTFVGAIIPVAALWFWARIATPDWVLIAANAYAEELLAACDKLHFSSHVRATRD